MADSKKEGVANSKKHVRKETYPDVRLLGDKVPGSLALMNHGLVYYPTSTDGKKVKLAWESIEKHYVSSVSPNILTVLYRNGKKVNFEIPDTLTRIRVLGEITSRMRLAKEERLAGSNMDSVVSEQQEPMPDGNDSFTSVGSGRDYLEEGLPSYASPPTNRKKWSFSPASSPPSGKKWFISPLISPESDRKKTVTGGRHSVHNSSSIPNKDPQLKQGRHSTHLPLTIPLSPTESNKKSKNGSAVNAYPTSPKKSSFSKTGKRHSAENLPGLADETNQPLSNTMKRRSGSNLVGLASRRHSTHGSSGADASEPQNRKTLGHSISFPEASQKKGSLDASVPKSPPTSTASKRLSTHTSGEDVCLNPNPATAPRSVLPSTNAGRRLCAHTSTKIGTFDVLAKIPVLDDGALASSRSSSGAKSLHARISPKPEVSALSAAGSASGAKSLHSRISTKPEESVPSAPASASGAKSLHARSNLKPKEGTVSAPGSASGSKSSHARSNPKPKEGTVSAPVSASGGRSVHTIASSLTPSKINASSEHNALSDKVAKRLALQNTLQSKGTSLRDQASLVRKSLHETKMERNFSVSPSTSLSPKRTRGESRSPKRSNQSSNARPTGSIPSIPFSLDESEHSFGEESIVRETPKSLHKLDENASFHCSGSIVNIFMEDSSSSSNNLDGSFGCDEDEGPYLKEVSSRSSKSSSRLGGSSRHDKSTRLGGSSRHDKSTRLGGSSRHDKSTRLGGSSHQSKAAQTQLELALAWEAQTVATDRTWEDEDVDDDKKTLLSSPDEDSPQRGRPWCFLLSMLLCALIGPFLLGMTIFARGMTSFSLRGSVAPSMAPSWTPSVAPSVAPTLSPTTGPTIFSNRAELDGLVPVDNVSVPSLVGVSNATTEVVTVPALTPPKQERAPKVVEEYGTVSSFERSVDCGGTQSKSLALSSAFNFTLADSFQEIEFPTEFWRGHEEGIALASFVFLREELERIYPDVFVSMSGERSTGRQYSSTFCHDCGKYEHMYRLDFDVVLSFSECVDGHQMLRTLPHEVKYKVLLATVNGIMPADDANQLSSRYPFGDVKVMEGHEKCSSTCTQTEKPKVRRRAN